VFYGNECSRFKDQDLKEKERREAGMKRNRRERDKCLNGDRRLRIICLVP